MLPYTNKPLPYVEINRMIVGLFIFIGILIGIFAGWVCTLIYFTTNPVEKIVRDEVKYIEVRDEVIEEFSRLSDAIMDLKEREAMIKKRENKMGLSFWVETGPLSNDTWVLRPNYRLLLQINPKTKKVTQIYIDPNRPRPKRPSPWNYIPDI